MNTNEVSFNFDDYIESNFKKESKNEPIIEKEEQYYICPVCGNYNISKDRFPVCSFCKNEKPQVLNKSEIEEIKELIKKFSLDEQEKYSYFEKADELFYKNRQKDNGNKETLKDGVIFREYLRQKYVFNNPAFSKEKYNDRVNQEYEKAVEMEEGYRKRQEEKSRPRCPKCGCTEFQMVPRKWSPLTGFLTNKVDREEYPKVCVNLQTDVR